MAAPVFPGIVAGDSQLARNRFGDCLKSLSSWRQRPVLAPRSPRSMMDGVERSARRILISVNSPIGFGVQKNIIKNNVRCNPLAALQLRNAGCLRTPADLCAQADKGDSASIMTQATQRITFVAARGPRYERRSGPLAATARGRIMIKAGASDTSQETPRFARRDNDRPKAAPLAQRCRMSTAPSAGPLLNRLLGENCVSTGSDAKLPRSGITWNGSQSYYLRYHEQGR